MAYSRVTRTRNGKAALEYAYGHNEKGHNEKAMRNQIVSGVNLIDGVSYLEQMQHYWNRARIGHKTQIIRVVQSFSLNEFDPAKESHIEKAHDIAREFAIENFPNRQAVIFTQIDGKSGLVHNHVLISDVSMEDNKGCDKMQYYYKSIEKWTNEITSKYTTLDNGREKTKDKFTQTERAKREKGQYVWKDDLKNRVHDAMIEAESQDDFEAKLPQHGVNFEKKSSKKYGEGYTYELMDLSNVPEGVKVPNRALKARSRTLGDSYGIEALNYVLDAKRKEKLFSNKEAIRKALDEFNLENAGMSKPDEEKPLKSPNTALERDSDSDTEDVQPEYVDDVVTDVDDIQYQQHVQQHIQKMRDDAESEKEKEQKAKISKRLQYLQKYDDSGEDTQDNDEYTR